MRIPFEGRAFAIQFTSLPINQLPIELFANESNL